MPTTDPTHVVPAVYDTIAGTLRVWEETSGSWVTFVQVGGGIISGVWRTGSGVPSNSLGLNGDLYLDNATDNVYQKVSDVYALATNIKGSTGATGAAGLNGTNGATLRDGSGIPDDAVGVNGDYYLNHVNGDVYKRAAGTYSVVANFTGPTGLTGSTGSTGATGAAGATWRSGSGVPSNGTGVDGDFYFDTATSDIYKRVGGAYSVIANVKGATGSTGSTGAAGADGATWRDGSGAPSAGLGANGDYYLDDATGNVYKKAAGSYSIVANIKGATGSTGSTGSTGTAGSVWRDGAGAPSAGLGVNGDYYLNDSNGDVYFKAAGAYSVVANIKGATGSTGAAGTSPVRKFLAQWAGSVVPATATTNCVTEVPTDSGGGSFAFTADRVIARLETAAATDQTFVVKVASGGDVAFATPTTVGTVTVAAGHFRGIVTGLTQAINSGDLLALYLTAGGEQVPFSVELLATA